MNLLIGRNQPPWDDDWQLDSKFFTQMEAWDAAHPESTLTKVLKRVNGAVTSCQPFIGCIPDSPFPARSLVQGLAYLLQLGSVRELLIPSIDQVTFCLQTVSSAKKDVYDFTTQVSTWFYAVETSFRGGTKKKFGIQAKKNLGVIRYVLCVSFLQRIAKYNRDLINEICKWGWARVVRLGHNKLLDAIKYAKLE